MNIYNFFDIFQENPNGSLSPKKVISVNGVRFSPSVSFGSGVSIGGIDFDRHRNQQIQAEDVSGVLYIRGFL